MSDISNALSGYFTSIANAIRAKTGKSDAIALGDMADEIESISSKGDDTSNMPIAYVGTDTLSNIYNTSWTQDSTMFANVISDLGNVYAQNVWSAGNNIYYSKGTKHYKLNQKTDVFEPTTWSGLTNFDGWYIWTDGDNVYYSGTYGHYVLDINNGRWIEKTWYGDGISDIEATNIWSDGENIYYSQVKTSGGSDVYYQYVLNKSTSTWSTKSWNGTNHIPGREIWTDGTNIYMSQNSSNQYVLNKSTSTWSTKSWSGSNLNYVIGEKVWTDGLNIYYSEGSTQKVLNKSTSKWDTMSWSGLTSFHAQYLWKYKNKIYYTNGTDVRYLYRLV